MPTELRTKQLGSAYGVPVSSDPPHSLLRGTDHRRPYRTPLGDYSNFVSHAGMECRLLNGAAGLGPSGLRGGTNQQHACQRKAAQRSMSASRTQPDHHRLLHNQLGLAFSRASGGTLRGRGGRMRDTRALCVLPWTTTKARPEEPFVRALGQDKKRRLPPASGDEVPGQRAPPRRRMTPDASPIDATGRSRLHRTKRPPP